MNEILLLGGAEAQAEKLIVMVDDVAERCKPAVVVEPAFLMCPKTCQRSRPITVCRRAVGLEAVDADLFGLVDRITRLGEARWDVTAGALRLPDEQCLASFRGGRVERTRRRRRRGDRELVEMKCVELCRCVGRVAATCVPGSASRCHRILHGI